MTHPNEPELSKLKELADTIKDPKKIHALSKQIARREAGNGGTTQQKGAPGTGNAGSSGN